MARMPPDAFLIILFLVILFLTAGSFRAVRWRVRAWKASFKRRRTRFSIVLLLPHLLRLLLATVLASQPAMSLEEVVGAPTLCYIYSRWSRQQRSRSSLPAGARKVLSRLEARSEARTPNGGDEHGEEGPGIVGCVVLKPGRRWNLFDLGTDSEEFWRKLLKKGGDPFDFDLYEIETALELDGEPEFCFVAGAGRGLRALRLPNVVRGRLRPRSFFSSGADGPKSLEEHMTELEGRGVRISTHTHCVLLRRLPRPWSPGC